MRIGYQPRIYESKRVEVRRTSGKCIMRTFIMCMYSSAKHSVIKKNEMGCACVTHGTDDIVYVVLIQVVEPKEKRSLKKT